MEDRETEEFVLVLERYYSQIVGMELPVEWKDRDPEPVERVPSYHTRHIVQDAPWNYCPTSPPKQLQQGDPATTVVRQIDLSIPPPPYILCEERRLSRSNSRDQFSIATSPSSVDHNMNEMQGLVTSLTSLPLALGSSPAKEGAKEPDDTGKESSSVADVAFTSDQIESGSEESSRPGRFGKVENIDLHSVVSKELLEPDVNSSQFVETKNHEAINRVTEMNRMVNDAQLYLRSDASRNHVSCETRRSDLGLKSNDSLLFIPRHGVPEEYNDLFIPRADQLPSESEAESTPTNSPTHTAAMLATEDPEANLKKMCSSFGLHSPFVSQQETEQDIEELLRQLQNSTALPFEENSLCLDPDIIDLTIVPPPSDDDVDFCCVTPDGMDNSKSFLDQETGQRKDVYNTAAKKTNPCEGEENGIVFSVQLDSTSSLPTVDSISNEPLDAAEDDISAYIIPPPPPSSSKAVEEQNRVLARFRQAAEEIQRMMAHGNENLAGSKYSDSMNSVSKFCTIPRRHEESHRPTLSSLASLVTPVRETHGKIGLPGSGSTPTTEHPSVDIGSLDRKDSTDSNSTVDSETGVSWRPQPPPRVKRNSLIAMDAAHNHVSGAFQNGLRSSADQSSRPVIQDGTSQNDTSKNEVDHPNCDSLEEPSNHQQTALLNGYHNGHTPQKLISLNGHSKDMSNGMDSDFYVNGEYNGYDSCEFQPGTTECEVCVGGKKGLVNGCACKKVNRFFSFHHSLPRKSMNTKLTPVNGGLLENGFEHTNNKVSFHSVQQEIADMIDNLDLACRSRLQECAECLPKVQPGDTKFVKVRDTLICESRQFVTASKLFVKSITESSDKMEEHLTTCVRLLDRIFAVGELVVTEMTSPSQINCLAEKLKEMAVAYSRTVQAAHSAAAGEIPNSNMAGLMHQATSLATCLTVLMRTLRTINGP